jgi:predicted subunit of tRNA(5-methylaminomethyl-2-thiouridylate) methyltransferase
VPDVLEDAREIVQEAVDLIIREADPGKTGRVQHVVSVESHRAGG